MVGAADGSGAFSTALGFENRMELLELLIGEPQVWSGIFEAHLGEG
jgi:hypothetical protein